MSIFERGLRIRLLSPAMRKTRVEQMRDEMLAGDSIEADSFSLIEFVQE